MQQSQSSTYVPLGIKEKLAYGLGDGASNISLAFITIFLLYFYTDIYGLTAAQGSIILLVGRIAEAVFNLLLGYFIDRTHSRYGKLRPYILFGCIPLAFLMVFCFWGIGGAYKFWFALLSYTLYCLSFTLVQTPYSALNNMMTQHEGSRSQLSVYRFALASIGYLLVSMTAEKLIALSDNPQTGYLIAAIIFAVTATILFILCFIGTKERVRPSESQEPISWKKQIRIISQNGPLNILSLYTVLIYVVYILWYALAIYYINYVIGDEFFMSDFFMIAILSYMVGTILSGWLIKRFGKKNITLGGLLLGSMALLIQYMAVSNLFLLMLCIVILQISLAISFVTMWAMVADTVEYSEWKMKIRAEGTIYGYYNFITRVAMGLGGALGGLLLKIYNYNPDEITAYAVTGINIGMTIIPAVFVIISVVFLFFYSIDEKKYRQMINEIAARSR